MASRAIVWVKENGGAEVADVLIQPHRLTASGIAIGGSPNGYRLDYKLETRSDFITSGLLVAARGEGWSRRLDLRRLRSGRWTPRTSSRGNAEIPAPRVPLPPFHHARPSDLALPPHPHSI